MGKSGALLITSSFPSAWISFSVYLADLVRQEAAGNLAHQHSEHADEHDGERLAVRYLAGVLFHSLMAACDGSKTAPL